MSAENQEIKYYKNKEGQSLRVFFEGPTYGGPICDIKTTTGNQTIHFKIDPNGIVSLGANCGGIGDPKSGLTIGKGAPVSGTVDPGNGGSSFGWSAEK